MQNKLALKKEEEKKIISPRWLQLQGVERREGANHRYAHAPATRSGNCLYLWGPSAWQEIQRCPCTWDQHHIPSLEQRRDGPRPISTAWRKRSGRQVNSWTATLKQDLLILFGPSIVSLHRWILKFKELVHDRRRSPLALIDAVKVKEQTRATKWNGKLQQVRK